MEVFLHQGRFFHTPMPRVPGGVGVFITQGQTERDRTTKMNWTPIKIAAAESPAPLTNWATLVALIAARLDIPPTRAIKDFFPRGTPGLKDAIAKATAALATPLHSIKCQEAKNAKIWAEGVVDALVQIMDPNGRVAPSPFMRTACALVQAA